MGDCKITRSTTPSIIVELEDTNISDLDCIYLTIISDTVKIEKSLEDGVQGDGPNILIFLLSQTETLQLQSDSNAQMQVKAKSGGHVFASDLINVSVKQILKEDEI